MIILKVTETFIFTETFYLLYVPKNTFLEKTQGAQTDPAPLPLPILSSFFSLFRVKFISSHIYKEN